MHGMTDTDAMFTYRKPSWHGLEGSNLLDEYPTREEAQKIAHNWENVTEPLFRRIPYIDVETGEPMTRFEEVEEYLANTRSDNGALLGVVSDTAGHTTNNDMYEIGEALEGDAPGEVMYETGGSLYGGKKVYLLLRLREPLVIKGDPNGSTLAFYALQNAYDNTGSFRGAATQVRIECANTSRMADLDAEAHGTEFVFRHSTNIRERIEDAKMALTGWRESVQSFKRMSEHLITEPVSDAAAAKFIEEFIPMPTAINLLTDRVKNNVLEAQGKLRTILEGPTCEGINRTSYGLLQAAIEYREHYRKANSQQSRFKRAMLDKDTLVTDAVELAMQAARESVGV